MKCLLEILKDSEKFLKAKASPSPRADAEWLMSHALNLKKIEMYTQFERPLDESELSRIRPLLKRRAAGEPVQYIIGETDFYEATFAVGPGVLIPRPETEVLVDYVISHYQEKSGILDLCTGSGAIILSLAKRFLDCQEFIGSDISTDALAWAEKNKERLGISNCSFMESDLFNSIPQQTFEVITINPPYVTSDDYAQLSLHIRDHEPRDALLAEKNGLDVIKRFCETALPYLIENGFVICEIGETQAADVRELFMENGWGDTEVVKDFNRKDRFVIGRK
ncbi:peptide chain release factor N(5)-glutamine methyltransferase [bacterium AH-315-E10]|nr:peptide chain release factor N(5)-glutamine methyltransferase [bacterium AH-315-E10]